MSSTELPRLYFDGHFAWNPSTYNNDDYAGGDLTPYDADTDTPNWAWLKQQVFDGNPVDEDNFRNWSYADKFELTTGGDKGQDLPPAEWNFFGGMECCFVTDDQPKLEQPPNPEAPGVPVFSKPVGDEATSISGYTGTAGYGCDDPIVGQPVQFNTAPPAGPFGASAKLIDINPTGPFTSQIFADDLQLGGNDLGFSGAVADRMHSRFLYFGRNLNVDNGQIIAGKISTVFQTVLHNDDISWTGSSPLLDNLRDQAGDACGLMLRMVAYDTRYFHGDFFFEDQEQFPSMLKMRELYIAYFAELAKFDAGELAEPPEPPCNRAYSRLVGWIGPWNGSAFTTVPGGRALMLTKLPYQPKSGPTPEPAQPRYDCPTNGPVPFGMAMVERTESFDRIAVDLGSAIPELTSAGDFAPFGAIDLGIELDGVHHKLATLVEESGDFLDAYKRTAGMVDIDTSLFDPIEGAPLSVEDFDANPLVIAASNFTVGAGDPSTWASTRATVLAENELYAQTQTRGLYVEESPAGVTEPTTQFVIDVTMRGAAPADQIGLVVGQYSENFAGLSGDKAQLIVSYQSPTGWIDIDNDTVVDATAGAVTIGLRGTDAAAQGVLPMLFFFPVATELVKGSGLSPTSPVTGVASAPAAFPGNPTILTTAIGYAAVKVLPFDSALVTKFESLLATGPDIDTVNTWVFDQVYKTFHLMYPVMDFIGTPQKFQAWRGRILAVTDPAVFDTASYMPPTRTVSAGKRRILELWDAYLSGVSEPGHPLRSKPIAAGAGSDA